MQDVLVKTFSVQQISLRHCTLLLFASLAKKRRGESKPNNKQADPTSSQPRDKKPFPRAFFLTDEEGELSRLAFLLQGVFLFFLRRGWLAVCLWRGLFSSFALFLASKELEDKDETEAIDGEGDACISWGLSSTLLLLPDGLSSVESS